VIRYDRSLPMKSDAIAFGIAGMAFGLLAGWIIGSQQAGVREAAPASSTAASSGEPAPRAAVLDDAKVRAFQSVAEREPSNPTPRVELGNLYFDAERYEESIKWYGEALKLRPNDANVSTDLGVSYFYTNQADKALEQFTHSLKIDPKHAKTLLNLGVVRAYGKQDLAGAEEAWRQLIALAPDSQEAQAARRALDSLKSAHPGGTAAQKPGD
jgi:tetratricopeptide (TPR) repeat protein